MSSEPETGDLFARYPKRPGYKDRKSETSAAAAHAVAAKAPSLQEAVLKVIAMRPSTADEVASLLRKSILSIRPRLSELRAMFKIVDSGVRRANESGKNAIVWKERQR